MSYALLPPLLSPSAAAQYKQALSPATPAVISAVQGAAENLKRNPAANSPAPLPPSSATWGRGGTSFFA